MSSGRFRMFVGDDWLLAETYDGWFKSVYLLVDVE